MRLSEADFQAYRSDKPRKQRLYRSTREIVANSEMSVRTEFKQVCGKPGTRELQEVYIKISGRASAIPSIKNSKIPGLNVLCPDVLSRIRAMDALFREIVSPDEKISFGSDPVVVILVCGKRGRRFDPHNCLGTIADWLEPPTKKVGKRRRGWGIGLIDDDRNATGIAFPGGAVGYEGEDSFILIRRWSEITDVMKELVLKALWKYEAK